MTEETETKTAPEGSGAVPKDTAFTPPPSGVPMKFWDSRRGTVRVESLLKAYRDLEARMRTPGGSGAPAAPEDYRIDARGGVFQTDPEVNARLLAAGFTQEQAQLAYDLANTYVMPAVLDVLAEEFAQAEVRRLVERFGGEERWQETARQLTAWGKAHLPTATYQALTTTFEGVVALHGMMTAGEPDLRTDGTRASGAESEEDLRKMMQDPRYWRDHDEAWVTRVTEGFKRLYPD